MENETEEQTTECPYCGREFVDGIDGWIVEGIDGNTYCSECQFGDYVEATVTRFGADGSTSAVEFCGGVAIETENGESPGECWTDANDLPEWFKDLFAVPEWHATNGWRGYVDVPSKGVKLADGWTTGWIDETVSRKHTVQSLGEALRSETRPDCDVFEIVSTTSNVFSLALDYYVRHDFEVSHFERWLAQAVGIDLDELKDALI